MEKLKLANGQEFDLVPMGIAESGKVRTFKFVSDLGYGDILPVLTSTNNYATVQVLNSSGDILNTYADCVSFKSLNFEKDVHIDDNTMADVYSVTYSIDAVERELASLKKDLDGTQILSDNAVGELTILIAGVYSLLS